MKEELFSFQKPPSNRPELKKTIAQILKAQSQLCDVGWYFIGHLPQFPETMIVDEEIRQIIRVSEIGNMSEMITIILSEAVVRRYCNILKANQNFKFKNGQIRIQFFSKNYVFLGQKSEIIPMEYSNSDKGEGTDEATRRVSFKSPDIKQHYQQAGISTKSKKLMNVNMAHSSVVIKNTDMNSPNLMTSRVLNPQQFGRLTKSEVYVNVKSSDKKREQLKSIVGKVVCRYDVGRGKINHGTGYQIEDIQNKNLFEVVIWAEVWTIPPLIKGKIYEFINFKVNHKLNYTISFHSHFMYSSIQQLG